MATEMGIDKRGQEFAGQDQSTLIGGDWVAAASGRTFDTYDPATGESMGTVL
jgi:phenylacetaldehyde dehydrogenase